MRNMQPRIWNKITGEIAMIDMIDWNDKYVVVSQDYIWNEDPETGEGECQVYFNDLELMWPTGLLDRNGVEIYEEDIVRYVDKNYEVYWTNGHFMGCNELWLDKDLQVIGNIYEHSHLLKQT